MNKKPLSFWQMINLNFGFLGIQFGWSLQMANMSGIYKFLGADISNMGYLWMAAPLTGMIIQPILGQLSDHTWNKIGRRRPYILIGALFSTLALILMPNSISVFMAASLLLVLDGSLNIAMQPYRALVADVAPAYQHTKCFAIQTCLVGIGSTLASSLPWLFLHLFHLQETTNYGIPLTLRLSFYIGAAVFLVANIWTVFFSKEYPPENMEKWLKAKQKRGCFLKMIFIDGKDIFTDFLKMPKIMREMSFVQFFSWIGMFCVFLYFGLGVAQNIFGLPLGAQIENNTEYRQMLEQGVALGGLCFSIYTFISIIYAFSIPYIAKKITRKGTHILSLTLGAIGLIAANYIHNALALFTCMIGLGSAWASIVTVPYAILGGSLPQEKMGLYMGLINIMICVPQIIAALTLGTIVSIFFHNHAMSIIELGGISFLVAAIFTFFVHDKEKV